MTEKIESVEIDELVALKILKHAKSSDDKETIGSLHGFFQNNIVEITHSYPIADQNRIAISQADYDHQMSKLSEEVHLDNNKVGWYHISYKSDNFVAIDTFEQQSLFQNATPHSIYLVYDVLEALRGVKSPFKAYQVSEIYSDLIEQPKVAISDLPKYNTKGNKIFIPLNVVLKRNPLASAFIGVYTKEISKKYENQYHPCLNVSSLLQKNAHYLNEAVEQLHESNYQTNAELTKKFKDVRVEKDIDPSKLIDNLLLADRVNTLTDNITDQSKFVSECTHALKHIS